MRRSIRFELGCCCLFVFLLASLQLLAAKNKKKKEGAQAEPYALLYGTCFDGRGFRMPGAKVLIELASEPSGKMKKKRWDTLSSPRGEFAVRLPAGPHTFRVAASKDGFKPAEKTVTFEGDERQTIVLLLKAEPAEK